MRWLYQSSNTAGHGESQDLMTDRQKLINLIMTIGLDRISILYNLHSGPGEDSSSCNMSWRNLGLFWSLTL